MIIRASGKHKEIYLPKKASTAFANGQAVLGDGSGAIEPVNATTDVRLIGFTQKEVTSADSDYASNTKIPLDAFDPSDIYEADVITGTLTTAMVGTRVDIAANGQGIDVTSTGTLQALIVGFISSTKALIRVSATAIA